MKFVLRFLIPPLLALAVGIWLGMSVAGDALEESSIPQRPETAKTVVLEQSLVVEAAPAETDGNEAAAAEAKDVEENLRKEQQRIARILEVHYAPENQPAFLAQSVETYLEKNELFGVHYGIDPVVQRSVAEILASHLQDSLFLGLQDQLSRGPYDPPSDEYFEKLGALQSQLEERLVAALGQETYGAYARYGESHREWKQVDAFSRFAAQKGVSLSLSEKETIVQILDDAHGKIYERSASEPLREILTENLAKALDEYVEEVALIKAAWKMDKEL